MLKLMTPMSLGTKELWDVFLSSPGHSGDKDSQAGENIKTV